MNAYVENHLRELKGYAASWKDRVTASREFLARETVWGPETREAYAKAIEVGETIAAEMETVCQRIEAAVA